MLKEKIKKGLKSPADVRLPDYNPDLFIHMAKSIKREKVKEKLENTSICIEDDDEAAIMMTGKSAAPPTKLRKIADGLIEFERYADRKKRIEMNKSKNNTL